MPDTLPSWATIESELATRPKGAMVLLAVRAAARLVPVIVEGSGDYGPEAVEWACATNSVVAVVEAFARGEKVSRFTLDLAAEIARGTANAAAGIVRLLGHSQAAVDSEFAFAAAAFAADAARLSSVSRIATATMQALRVAQASGRVPDALSLADYTSLLSDTPLWPDGEPRWFTEARVKLDAAVELPVMAVRFASSVSGSGLIGKAHA